MTCFFVIGVMLVLVMMWTLLMDTARCPFCGGRTQHEKDCWYGKEKL